MIKEYEPTTNRYFVRIKLNYVYIVPSGMLTETVYTIWMCCVFADRIETVLFQWHIYHQISI